MYDYESRPDLVKEKITSLAGLLNKESLTETHDGMSMEKASGVDQVTKEKYGRKLINT